VDGDLAPLCDTRRVVALGEDVIGGGIVVVCGAPLPDDNEIARVVHRHIGELLVVGDGGVDVELDTGGHEGRRQSLFEGLEADEGHATPRATPSLTDRTDVVQAHGPLLETWAGAADRRLDGGDTAGDTRLSAAQMEPAVGPRIPKSGMSYIMRAVAFP